MPSTSQIQAAGPLTAPVIQNIPVQAANTELPISIPANTGRLFLKVRGGLASLQLAWEANQSGTVFLSIGPGGHYYEDGLDLSLARNLYLRCSRAGVTIEVLSWGR